MKNDIIVENNEIGKADGEMGGIVKTTNYRIVGTFCSH